MVAEAMLLHQSSGTRPHLDQINFARYAERVTESWLKDFRVIRRKS